MINLLVFSKEGKCNSTSNTKIPMTLYVFFLTQCLELFITHFQSINKMIMRFSALKPSSSCIGNNAHVNYNEKEEKKYL